mgnify:CR=1 FL=1
MIHKSGYLFCIIQLSYDQKMNKYILIQVQLTCKIYGGRGKVLGQGAEAAQRHPHDARGLHGLQTVARRAFVERSV